MVLWLLLSFDTLLIFQPNSTWGKSIHICPSTYIVGQGSLVLNSCSTAESSPIWQLSLGLPSDPHIWLQRCPFRPSVNSKRYHFHRSHWPRLANWKMQLTFFLKKSILCAWWKHPIYVLQHLSMITSTTPSRIHTIPGDLIYSNRVIGVTFTPADIAGLGLQVWNIGNVVKGFSVPNMCCQVWVCVPVEPDVNCVDLARC